MRVATLTATAALAASALAGCGAGSSSRSAAPAGTATPSAAGSPTLAADARSAATGDIPDNQMFLRYSDPRAGFAIRYPEGWTQAGSAGDVTFRDKNNVVHVRITAGPEPSPSSIGAQLRALARADATLRVQAPQRVRVSSSPAIRARYTTESAPNPVTGKRVRLAVDRYALFHAGRVATVDLGTPAGVDNVDAYRMMIASFRWL